MKSLALKFILAITVFSSFLLSGKTALAAGEGAVSLGCGNDIPASRENAYECTCDNGAGFIPYTRTTGGAELLCCGWVQRNGDVASCGASATIDGGPTINITEGPSNATFDALNPLIIGGSDSVNELSTPGGIVSRLLRFLFPLAGLILFLLISWGGFEILAGSASQKGMEAGRNRITAAIIGFILLFSSYWLVQIVEVVFGITIL